MLTVYDDRVLVKKTEAPEERTQGNIIVVNSVKEIPNYGEVVSVGKGAYDLMTGELLPMRFGIGQRVWFTKNTGTDIPMGDGNYILIKQGDILKTDGTNT